MNPEDAVDFNDTDGKSKQKAEKGRRGSLETRRKIYKNKCIIPLKNKA